MTLSEPGTKSPDNRKNIAPYMPLLAYIAFILLAAITANYAFRQIEGVVEKEKLREFGIIAEAKAGQIKAWRNTQTRMGETFSHGSLLAEEFDQWLRDGMQSTERKHRIWKLLTELQHANEYTVIVLLDRQGTARASSNGNYVPVAEEAILAAQAMDSRTAVFSDFHRASHDGKRISIDLAVPLTVADNKTDRIVGAAVLHIDPGTFLYPLIQSWPTHLGSAEILLVRREGNDVVYLNELRHSPDSALFLRTPLTLPNRPAAMAIRGETSSANGINYRGVPVVAAMREIPGTPWFMVAQADRDELFAPVNQLKTWASYFGLAFTLLGGGLIVAWLNIIRQQNHRLKAQQDVVPEREMPDRHLEYLTRFAVDNILLANMTGQIAEANEQALKTFGYTREALLQKNLSDLFLPEESTGTLFNEQLEQIIELGELCYETINQRKDGTTFPAETRIRIIEEQGTRILHCITHDITERKNAEQMLRQQKNFTLQVIDTVPDLIFITDSKGKFLLVNQAMAALHNVEPQELVGQIDAELFKALEQTGKHLKMSREVLEARRQVEFIKHNFLGSKDNWLHFTKVPMEQPDGTVHVLSIGVNITERKKAEQVLRQQKNFTLQIIDSVPNIIFVTDARGKFLLVNRFMATLHNLRPEKLIGQIDAELFMNNEQAAQHLEMDNKVIKTRDHVEFITHNLIGDKERWLHFTKVPMEQPDGTVHVLSIGVDITGRKEAEQVLRQQKNFTLQVIDTDPNLIFVTDAEGKFLLANQAMAALHGMRPEELVGQIDTELFKINEQAGQHFRMDYEVLENRRKVQFTTHNFIDGKSRWIHFTKVPMVQPDGAVHVLSIGVDVTERKQFEEIRADMEHAGRLNIAGEMASSLAHELSQPLTACNNYLVGCIRRMDDNIWDKEKLMKAVQLAQKQSERAGAIINHLKSMVRKQGHEHTLVDINLLAKDVMILLEDEIEREGISIRMALSPIPQVMVCKVEIEQVLLNLYKNAIESMHTCMQRRLCISTRTTEDNQILVSVSDSGIGISSAESSNLFSPFHTSKKEGLGLGLVICRSFIENHGGRIWATSSCGLGTEFCFTLPAGATHE